MEGCSSRLYELSRAIVFVSTYDNEAIVVCAHKKLDKTERDGWLADSSLDLAIVDCLARDFGWQHTPTVYFH